MDRSYASPRSARCLLFTARRWCCPCPFLACCKRRRAARTRAATCQANGQCTPTQLTARTCPHTCRTRPVPATDAATVIPDAQTPVAPMDAAAEKVSDTAGDRARDLAPDLAGGRDAFFATGGVGGTDAPSATGGAIGTGGARQQPMLESRYGTCHVPMRCRMSRLAGAVERAARRLRVGVTASGARPAPVGPRSPAERQRAEARASAGGATTAGRNNNERGKNQRRWNYDSSGTTNERRHYQCWRDHDSR